MIRKRLFVTESFRVALGLALILSATPLYSANWNDAPPLLSDFDNPDYREWLPSAREGTATSVRLNDMGYLAYLDDRLVEAARLWKAALLMDPENPWSHYNYASVLAVFAGGFGDFDAPGEGLPRSAWDRDDFWEYRETILHHLRISIYLNPDRLARMREDSDFDTVRELPGYVNILMGVHPDAAAVIGEAPEWFSLQPGAFLPKDIFTFSRDGHVEYQWDASGRMLAFPDFYSEGEDHSFSGTWVEAGESIEITTDDGHRLTCSFDHKMDDYGFIITRILIFDGVKYGDYEAHYWEGQDG